MNEHVHPAFRNILNAIAPRPEPLLMADASVIHAALLDVIDGGDPECKSLPWALWHPFASIEDDARMRFSEALLTRIRQLQAPPISLGVKLENLCPRHMRTKLPQPTASTCAACDSEMERRFG